MVNRRHKNTRSARLSHLDNWSLKVMLEEIEC